MYGWTIYGHSIYSNSPTRLALLAPSSGDGDLSFGDVEVNPRLHSSLMAELQRLRGSIYLSDGAIQRTQVTRDGRHWHPADEKSWHVLAFQGGRMIGCARYLEHCNTIGFENLGVRRSSLGSCQEWRGRLKAAVDKELALARQQDLKYAEVGGWAIAEEHRGSREALRIALATYGLAQMLGGCLGITTATARHGSSAILRRIGGAPLEAEGECLPVYFDPQYGCDMEILRFDSRQPAERYRAWVEELRGCLSTAPIIARSAMAGSLRAQLGQLNAVVSSGYRPIFDYLPAAP